MTPGKTVATAAVANTTATVGTDNVRSAVPFLEAHLWFVEVGGVLTVITPQAMIVITTGVLSVIALLASIFKKVKA